MQFAAAGNIGRVGQDRASSYRWATDVYLVAFNKQAKPKKESEREGSHLPLDPETMRWGLPFSLAWLC
uniref:Uncharacterized protein n=1 Tax=Thermogemmatispora argillosa TaxID=2045280 RepID=A0A455T8J8_9CHLR|nr:hypothetical protein KTA_38740 [Thermogemmatispora argillosa]